MASTSGINLINNLPADTANLNLQANQAQLAQSTERLSSGLRINSAADDPSGLAISQSLQAQVNGFDQAGQNVQNATNLAAVAEGALSTTTDILQRLRSLAVEAASGINSQSDLSDIQTEMNQLLQEVNSIAQNTTFNNQSLLDGSHAGFQAAQQAAVDITTNASLASTGGGIINGYNYGLLAACVTPSLGSPTALSGFYSTGATGAGVGAAYAQGFTTGTLGAGGTTDGTIELQVINTGSSIAVVETFFNSGIDPTAAFTTATVTGSTGGLTAGTYTIANAVSVSASYLTAGGSYTLFDNVKITLGQFGTNDVGQSTYIKVTQEVAAQSNPTQPAYVFQSGSNEGQTISVGLSAVNTQTLRISNINVLASTPNNPNLASEDAIGQIDFALQSVLEERANLGAVVVRLQEDQANDATAANNLQASESNIADLNVAEESTNYNRLETLVQVGTSVLAQANLQPSTVQRLFQ